MTTVLTEALTADADVFIVVVGAVNGGIWKTSNATAASQTATMGRQASAARYSRRGPDTTTLAGIPDPDAERRGTGSLPGPGRQHLFHGAVDQQGRTRQQPDRRRDGQARARDGAAAGDGVHRRHRLRRRRAGVRRRGLQRHDPHLRRFGQHGSRHLRDGGQLLVRGSRRQLRRRHAPLLVHDVRRTVALARCRHVAPTRA